MHLRFQYCLLQRQAGWPNHRKPFELDVIDGQQRLVTLVLIYAVLHYCFTDLNTDNDEELQRFATAIRDRMLPPAAGQRAGHGHRWFLIVRQNDEFINAAEQPIDREVFNFGRKIFMGYRVTTIGLKVSILDCSLATFFSSQVGTDRPSSHLERFFE